MERMFLFPIIDWPVDEFDELKKDVTLTIDNMSLCFHDKRVVESIAYGNELSKHLKYVPHGTVLDIRNLGARFQVYPDHNPEKFKVIEAIHLKIMKMAEDTDLTDSIGDVDDTEKAVRNYIRALPDNMPIILVLADPVVFMLSDP